MIFMGLIKDTYPSALLEEAVEAIGSLPGLGRRYEGFAKDETDAEEKKYWTARAKEERRSVREIKNNIKRLINTLCIRRAEQ